MIYDYPDFPDGWKISDIEADVMASAMTDKSWEWGRWDATNGTGLLQLKFTNELSPADKAILDQIVEDNK